MFGLKHVEKTRQINFFSRFVRSFSVDLAKKGQISIRLDTHGGRFLQGLDTQSSYAVLERNVPEAIRGYRSESELKNLMGKWQMQKNKCELCRQNAHVEHHRIKTRCHFHFANMCFNVVCSFPARVRPWAVTRHRSDGEKQVFSCFFCDFRENADR